MEVSLRKHITNDIIIINFAAYKANVIIRENELHYEKDILGIWDMERYITLLMGEIPRLTDDVNGYGPKGKDFIIHVDIPTEVNEAFLKLKDKYKCIVREANPLYASKIKE